MVVEVGAQMLIERGATRLKAMFNRQAHHPVVGALGYLMLGGVLGGLSVLVQPHRVLRPAHGLSLVLGPLVSGTAMSLYGQYLRSRDYVPTNLATFLGGA